MFAVVVPGLAGLLALASALGFVVVLHHRDHWPSWARQRTLPSDRQPRPVVTAICDGRSPGICVVASAQDLAIWLHEHRPASIGPGNLRADMLPGGTWGSNLRGILSETDWRKLSRACSAVAGDRCQVCGQPVRSPAGRQRRPDCHELWSFDYLRCVQVLTALAALCPDCHRVQHTGRAYSVGEDHLVIAKLRAVNRWSEAQATAEMERAWTEHERRSRHEWSLDLSILAGIVTADGCPSLFVPAPHRASLGNSYWSQPWQ